MIRLIIVADVMPTVKKTSRAFTVTQCVALCFLRKYSFLPPDDSERSSLNGVVQLFVDLGFIFFGFTGLQMSR